MSRLALVLSVLLASIATADARARGRTDTRALTCAALKALVDQDGDVVLASSD